MTTTSQIITDAFRQSNLLAIGTQPTPLEQQEALRYLNRIFNSVFGNEAGENFTAFPIGNKNIDRPRGYPWYGNVPDNNWFVPKNTRLMCNLDEPLSIFLHPAPNDGTRVAINDASKTFGTNNVTVHGNGNLIDGQFSTVLDVDGFEGEWFYRADLSTWVRYSPIGLDTEFPFPEDFDDFFITMLAMRINPSYGRELDGQSDAVLSRSRNQLRARYSQSSPTHSELGLIRPARVAIDRDMWGSYYSFYNPNSMFDKGWPF